MMKLTDRTPAAASRRDHHPDIVQNCSVCRQAAGAASAGNGNGVNGVQSSTNSHRQVTDLQTDRPSVSNADADDEDVVPRQNSLDTSQFDHF